MGGIARERYEWTRAGSWFRRHGGTSEVAQLQGDCWSFDKR